MTINKHVRNRNRLVLTALGVWFALAAAIFSWFSVQNYQFAGQLQQSKHGIKSVVDAAPAKVKAARDGGDVNAMMIVLRELSTTVSQSLKSLPTTPSLAGLYVGADAERSQCRQLRDAGETYVANLNELADFVAYQSGLARHLQGLSLKDANGYNQTIELANAWHDVIKKVQNEPKPVRLTDVIATLLQKMTTAETTIREMAELHKKADSEGFTAKQTALAVTIAEFKAVGAQIGAVAMQLDTELAASATKLRKNL